MHKRDAFDPHDDAPAPEETALSTWLDDPAPYVALSDDRVFRMLGHRRATQFLATTSPTIKRKPSTGKA